MEQTFDLFGNPIEQKGNLKKDFGANPFSIKCCKGKRKHHGGYEWKYAN